MVVGQRPVVDEARHDLRPAVSIAAALAVIGILLGLVWTVWSPKRPPARVTAGGRLQFESETWIAADGRYLVLVVAAGLVAAIAAWTRARNRGPVLLLGLAVGGAAGAALTWLTGWLVGGGSDNPATGGYIPVTRLTLHTPGLLFLEAGVAVLVYGLCVAFTARDDLGRDDRGRDDFRNGDQAPSVGSGPEAQYGWRYGDAAGSAQQRDFPPQ